MKVINQFLQEITASYGKIKYSPENLKELRKKRYMSNGYYWFYVGKTPGGKNSNGQNYAEIPEHCYCWNMHHPDNKVTPKKTNLIHHKNENKLDNRIQNLEKVTIKKHNRDHLTKRRKEMPNIFKNGSSKGGKKLNKH